MYLPTTNNYKSEFKYILIKREIDVTIQTIKIRNLHIRRILIQYLIVC